MNWNYKDFILHGKHCDYNSISQELDVIRAEIKAVTLFMYVFQGGKFLRALTIVSDADIRRKAFIQQEIISESVIEMPKLPSWDNENFDQDFLNSVHYNMSGDYRDSIIIIRKKEKISESNLPDDYYSCIIVVAIYDDIIDNDNYGYYNVDKLFFMVNSTTLMIMQRRMEINNRNDNIFDASVLVKPVFKYYDGTSDISNRVDVIGKMQEVSIDFLNSVIKSTKSQCGAIYFVSNETGLLSLVAFVGNCTFPKEIPRTSNRNIITSSYKKKVPILLNRNLFPNNSDPTKFSIYQYEWHEDTTAVLANPIELRSVTTNKSRILGVLVLEKRNDNLALNNFYTHRDLAIVRDMCLKFCLVRSSLFNSLINNIFWEISSYRPMNNNEHDNSIEGVFNRFNVIKNMIDSVLAQIYELTDSCWVCFTTISHDGKNLKVFSVVDYGKIGIPVDYIAFPVDYNDEISSYMCSHVFKTGIEEYVPTLRNGKGLLDKYKNIYKSPQDVRRNVKTPNGSLPLCCYCVPVFLDGRIIGTLNIESVINDGLSDSISFIRTIASLIGILFSKTLDPTDFEMVEQRIRINYAAHEIAKQSREIKSDINKNYINKKLSERQVDTLMGQVLIRIDEIYDQCNYIKNPHSEDHPDDVCSIIWLVVNRLNMLYDLNTDSAVRWFSNLPKNDYKLDNYVQIRRFEFCKNELYTIIIKDEKIRKILFMIFIEIMRNYRNSSDILYSMTSKINYIHINTDVIKKSGKKFFRIYIQGVCGDLNPDVIGKLYMEPIIPKNIKLNKDFSDNNENIRVRMGAYLSGVLIRSIGGDIFHHVLTKKGVDYLVTQIHIPVGL